MWRNNYAKNSPCSRNELKRNGEPVIMVNFLTYCSCLITFFPSTYSCGKVKYRWYRFSQNNLGNCQLSFVNNLRSHWFFLTSLSDWSRKLALPFKPIRYKTDTSHDLVIRVFPRFGNFFEGAWGWWMFEHFGFSLNRKALCRRLSSRKHGLRHLQLHTHTKWHLQLHTRTISLEWRQRLRGWWLTSHWSKSLRLRELLKTILKKNDLPKRFLSILKIDVDS